MIGLTKIAMAAAVVQLTAPGPQGPLSGTLTEAGGSAPVVVIIPGSGPTDRDGNNPMGVSSASYRLLAEALAAKAVSSLRIDKRGLFGSKAAIADPAAVTIGDYSADARSWAKVVRARTDAPCVWLLGHSEGGLVALEAAQRPEGICGVILVAAPGRKLGEVMREQLRSNPANAPVLDDALAAIDSLEANRPVDVSAMHPALQGLFAPKVQPFLMDMMAQDAAQKARALRVPLLIVQGGRDVQVTMADFDALRTANPKARHLLLPKMTHVLKDASGDDRASSLATYADASLPLSPGLAEAISAFVKCFPRGGAGTVC